MNAALIERARCLFRQVFGGDPAFTAHAPGRVNLIGEHTDYNDGFVFPMALSVGVVVAARRRRDGKFRVHAARFGETRDLPLGDASAAGESGWALYARGAVSAWLESHPELRGVDLVIDADLPIGAGLSSSAALLAGLLRAFAEMTGAPWVPLEMARLCQRIEHEAARVRCGIMDPMAVIATEKGSALLLDCRSLHTRSVALPQATSVVVMETGVRRTLAGSAYNERRASCERALDALRQLDPSIRALRDVDEALLARSRTSLDATTFDRAAHVVAECGRPAALAAAFERNDVGEAGRVMNASHESLQRLYEVSCAELDAIVEIARSQEGCFGARMTGAGFGGCAVALVDSTAAAAFVADVRERYRRRTSREGRLFLSGPEAGARIVG